MRDSEYARLNELEESLWWLLALRRNVITLLGRHARGGPLTLLDAGCGTGGMMKAIAGRFPEAVLYGLDYSQSACALARAKTSAVVLRGSVNELPYADGTFDVIVSLDVLNADGTDPAAAIAEFRRVLQPDGLLILNLAAYQWMLSYHDRAVGQSRRFSLGDVNGLLQQSGLRRLQGTYWNTFLFPLMILRRKVLPAPRTGSDVQAIPGPLDALFRHLVSVEGWIIGTGVSLPFGGSVLAVARKEAT